MQSHEEYELLATYKKMGIATFGFFTGLAFAFPVIIGTVKYKWKSKQNKIIFIFGLTILFISYIKAQYTAAFLYALTGSIIALIGKKNKMMLIFFIFLVITVSVSYSDFAFIDILSDVAGNMGSSFLQERLNDFGVFLKSGADISISNTHAGEKLSRIPLLVQSAKTNPFLSGGLNFGHNFWFDWLSLYGIIGLIPWIVIILQQIKLNLKIFNTEFKTYYLLSMFSFISFGFINALRGSHIYASVFVLIPGMFFSIFNFTKIKTKLI